MARERMDGKPLTTADKKTYALRDAGYRGAIDQDGNKVADVDAWIKEQQRKGK